MSFHRSATFTLLGYATVAVGRQPSPPDLQTQRETLIGDIQITENINSQKINGIELGRLYHKFSGRRLIVSPAAATTEFSLMDETDLQHPISYKQAAELAKKSALRENFAFICDDKDSNLDVLTVSAGVRISDPGLAVYNDSETLPDGDAVISYVMTLKHFTPDAAMKNFKQTPARLNSRNDFSSIAAVPNASVIVITDRTTNIRKFIALIAEIDKP